LADLTGNISVGTRAALVGVLGLMLAPAMLYTPGSPMRKQRVEMESAQLETASLSAEVATLQANEARLAMLERKLGITRAELASLEAMMPTGKEADEFIRLLQQAASQSNMRIRRITSKPVVAREYHYEMPFEVEVEGTFFGLQDFFSALSHLERITSVGDLTLAALGGGGARPKNTPAGATVNATFTVTTYFAGGEDAEPSGAQKK
jgi:Tfp pilus assembly protein PilO